MLRHPHGGLAVFCFVFCFVLFVCLFFFFWGGGYPVEKRKQQCSLKTKKTKSNELFQEELSKVIF